MTDVLVRKQIDVFTIGGGSERVVLNRNVMHVVESARQGVPGPRGPQGAPGGATLIQVGTDPLSGHSAVAMNADGLLIYADCTQSGQLGAVLGLLGNAYSPGDMAVVLTDFDLTHTGWSFTVGPVFVGTGGALVQVLPPGAAFAQVVGFALSPTRVRIDVQPPIALT